MARPGPIAIRLKLSGGLTPLACRVRAALMYEEGADTIPRP